MHWPKKPRFILQKKIHLESQKNRQNLTVSAVFMAPQKEFESPTFRLGGGRSILLSYRGMCCIIVAEI